MSSQKELRKYYKASFNEDIKTRKHKIDTVQEELNKKQAVKNFMPKQENGTNRIQDAKSKYVVLIFKDKVSKAKCL